VISDKFHTAIGVVVKIVFVVVVTIVVEGTAVGVVVDTIVLLLKYVVVVRVIMEDIVALIGFDVRNAGATIKKREIVEKSIEYDVKLRTRK
jgi:hypothetical protein